jgi:DNA-binding transcriptional regulator YhcF (GntR family)
MKLLLDHASPVPLYHQIAEALRYRIATGALPSGTVLPPLREAAGLWGANLHTVRRAYTELGRAGVVVTRVARGTVVLPPAGARRPGGRERARLESFLQRMLREARDRHGLEPGELVDLLAGRRPPVPTRGRPTVYVAECSDTQSADLAAQLMERWQVTALPWRVDRPAPPAGKPIVSTYFHYNDVRARWAGRLDDVHFLAITPDPSLGARLRRRTVRRRGDRMTVVLCEREEAMLRNILADLHRVLPEERFDLQTRRVAMPARWLAARRSPGPILFSPRLWGELPPKARSDPRVHEVRFVIEPKDLDAIGTTLGWTPRSTSRAPGARIPVGGSS